MSGDVDIKNIQSITKEELLSFYDKYILPSSPERSVLSVHVKSQVAITQQEFSTQLAEGVKAFVTSEGYEIPPAELSEVLQSDMSVLPEKLFSTLIARGYDPSRVERSLVKGQEMFAAQTTPVANGTVRECPLREVKVSDLTAFRSTLELDEKPLPVQPLETFYESGSPKL
jgi:insulysin